MAHGVCPVWLGYFLISPLRKWGQNPDKILGPFVSAGMKVLDVGSAMGFFSLPMARMVGPEGEVVCVDMQEKMLEKLAARARKADLLSRIRLHRCKQETLELEDLRGSLDFALLFAVVHEVPDKERLFAEVHASLAPGATLFMAEPKGHVSEADFGASVAVAEKAGFSVVEKPAVARSRAIILRKS